MLKKIPLFLIMLVSMLSAAFAESGQTEYRVTASVLNVRSGAGTSYRVIGKLYQSERVTVLATTHSNGLTWGKIFYHEQIGYVAMVYLEAVAPAQTTTSYSYSNSSSSGIGSFFSWLWGVIKVVFWIVVVLIVIAFKDELIQLAVTIGAFAGIGALVGWLLFGNASVGALIGLGIIALIGLRILAEALNGSYAGLLTLAYKLISLPLFYTNRWQHILTEPWRYFYKTGWPDENIKPNLRLFLNGLQIVLYIVTTPLRLFNAMAYNLVVHVVTVLYDLIVEVFQPSCYNEGDDGVGQWILMLPWRIIKYPIFHGAIAIIEGFIWTVVDIFIPAITMYHGTDLPAAQDIVCCPTRNAYLKNSSLWTHGTFAASRNGWGGIGVYFASKRTVAELYACDEHRLSDNNPCMIVCRVSLGNVLNYSLAPWNVYRQAGEGGDHAKLNQFGLKHNYTTGEWWNPRGYWEYCLFDWQNRYNHPWRIRPVYVFNFRTGLAQHIKGGMQHWLFDQSILSDLLGDTK